MNNFVAKHNHNRASTHKTARDYSRVRLSALDWDIETLTEYVWGI